MYSVETNLRERLGALLAICQQSTRVDLCLSLHIADANALAR